MARHRYLHLPSLLQRRAIAILFGLATLAVALFGCASKPSPSTAAPSAGRTTNGYGVLLMAHGGLPEWNAAVLETVKPLRERYDIEVALGMADAASLQEAVRKLEARGVRRIGVVRLFISGESFTSETEQILGLRPGAPDASEAANAVHPILTAYAQHYANAGTDAGAGDSNADGGLVDPHAAHGGDPHLAAAHAGHGDPHAGHAGHGDPAAAAHGGHGDPAAAHAGHGGGHEGHSMAFFRVATQSSFALSQEGLVDATGMGAVLADRATALSKAPAKEDVLILAHGPGDDAENARWLAKLDERAAVLRSRAPFRRVQVETLREDWPDKRTEAEKRIRAYVERATAEGGKAIVLPFRVQGFGPYARVLEGLDYASDGKGLIPHAEVTRWIEHEITALEAGPFRAPTAN